MNLREYKRKTEKELIGCRVETLEDMRNGYVRIPKGTKAHITRKFKGFNLESDPCPHCGVSVRITRVDPKKVKLI